ncbi:hypothetical protein KSP40_PGU005983 [Platanthera guangdongensis]|uniref:Uncharacterized protein n=1 Tax=Platanthera guangdongensis TaxID=2320717 RepID=A0ABR2LV60_9ASPA
MDSRVGPLMGDQGGTQVSDGFFFQVDPTSEGLDRGAGSLIKWNPVPRDIRNFLGAMDVPMNSLRSWGHVSIGYEPCTSRAVREGGEVPRWWWQDARVKECTLRKGNIPQGNPQGPASDIHAASTVNGANEVPDIMDKQSRDYWHMNDISDITPKTKREFPLGVLISSGRNIGLTGRSRLPHAPPGSATQSSAETEILWLRVQPGLRVQKLAIGRRPCWWDLLLREIRARIQEIKILIISSLTAAATRRECPSSISRSDTPKASAASSHINSFAPQLPKPFLPPASHFLSERLKESQSTPLNLHPAEAKGIIDWHIR